MPAEKTHTVRSGPWRAVNKAFLIVVFAVVGLAVYQLGLKSAERSTPARSYTCTAWIRQRAAGQPDLAGGSQAAVLPGPGEAETQILSAGNVYRAVRQLGLAVAPRANEDEQAMVARVVEPVREALKVAATGTPTPGQLDISVTCTNQDPVYAVRLANTLAKDYADDCRTQWEKHAQAACDEARDASAHARQQWLAAQARLDEFYEQQLKQQEADAEEAEPAGQATQTPAAEGPLLSGEPAMVENPKWVELSEQLAGLRQRREQLLVDRTPAHPAVQDSEIRIAAIEQQLAATARMIPGKASDSPVAAVEDPQAQPGRNHTPTEAEAGRRAAAAREFRTLKDAVALAQQVYEGAVLAENSAFQQRQHGPQIELRMARPFKVPPPEPVAAGLVLMALAGGIAAAVGVGMISVGAAVEAPLATVAQARQTLPVPVVGVIPRAAANGEPRARRGERLLLRWGMILGGLGLVGGCACVLIRAIAG